MRQTPASSAFARTALLGDVGSSLAPSEEFSSIDVADSLMFHKRYQEAIAGYAGVQPKDAAVWKKMGIAYQMMYDLNDAERCYKEAIKLNPKDAEAFNNLGTLYESQLDHGRAEKMFRSRRSDRSQFRSRIQESRHQPD